MAGGSFNIYDLGVIMVDFTREDLNIFIRNEGSSLGSGVVRGNVRVSAGEYMVSIAYGEGMYSIPCKLVDPSEYSKVEIALFKGGEWFLDQDQIPGFKWAAKFTDRGSRTAVAPYVEVSDVIDIINHLRGLVKPQQKDIQSKMGCCRRCKGYDPYIDDGDLCWRCCG